MLFIAGGTFLGLFAALMVIRMVLTAQSAFAMNRKLTRRERTVVTVVVAVAFPFSWFVAFVVGGNFGGSYTAYAVAKSGILDDEFTNLGIGLGISIVLCIFMICAAGLAIGLIYIFRRIREYFDCGPG